MLFKRRKEPAIVRLREFADRTGTWEKVLEISTAESISNTVRKKGLLPEKLNYFIDGWEMCEKSNSKGINK